MTTVKKTDGIPDAWLDNEVRMKKNPDDCYSAEFVEANKKKLEAFLTNRKKS
jgi:hypothetical protein